MHNRQKSSIKRFDHKKVSHDKGQIMHIFIISSYILAVATLNVQANNVDTNTVTETCDCNISITFNDYYKPAVIFISYTELSKLEQEIILRLIMHCCPDCRNEKCQKAT